MKTKKDKLPEELDATGETFLCPYCQTWLELPPVLKAEYQTELAEKDEQIAFLTAENKKIFEGGIPVMRGQDTEDGSEVNRPDMCGHCDLTTNGEHEWNCPGR